VKAAVLEWSSHKTNRGVSLSLYYYCSIMSEEEEESAAVVAGTQHQRQHHKPSPNSMHQDCLLNWRMDPKASRSDFTIEMAVSEQDENTATVYHVHKNILEFGRKRGGYFAGLFAGQTAESMNDSLKVRLKCQSAVESFPIFLDYMYGLDDGEPALTIANAAPLYHLADYFWVKILHPEILEFWKETMEVKDLAVCLKQAGTYGIDSLHEIVVKKCSENIDDVAVDSPLLDESDSKFWLAVTEIGPPISAGSFPRLFLLLTEFCFRRKDDLDGQTFHELTKSFPHTIPFGGAMKLLEAEKIIYSSASPEDGPALNFQRYLLEAVTRDWRRWKNAANPKDLQKKIGQERFLLATNMALELANEEIEAFQSIAGRAPGALPTTISVTGAGFAAANGVYSRGEYFGPTDPHYAMKGQRHGNEDFVFHILLSEACWDFFFERADSADSHLLYGRHPFTPDELYHLPPMKGWRGFVDDKSEPTLTYHFD